MEIELYTPCKPDWLCHPFAIIFAVLSVIGILLFIGLIYKEYKRLERVRSVLKHRKTHYKIRQQMEKPYRPIRRPNKRKW